MTLDELLILLEEYYDKKQPDAVIELYHKFLADIPVEILAVAIKHHIATKPWFPKINEIRDAATQLQIGDVPTAVEAWQEVQSEIRRVGHRGAPEFSNKITERVVKGIGWTTLCMSETQMVDRAHFIKAYDQRKQIAQDDVNMLPEVRELTKKLEIGDGK